MFKKLSQLKSIFHYIDSHPLAGRHRAKAYSKFIQWQILQAINPRPRKVPFTNKTFLIVEKGMTGATGNIYLGLHEFTDMGFLLHFLRDEDVFFDIGANVGSYTVLAAGHCKAKCVSFEPVPSTFDKLQKNIKENQISDLVIAKNIALGEAESTIAFTADMDTVNHVVLNNAQNKHTTIQVPVTTGDSFLSDFGCPILLKIDVEGFETSVLNGMEEILENTLLRAIIIELNGSGERYGFSEADIHIKLMNKGFRPFTYSPITRVLSLLQQPAKTNTIYLRDEDFVLARIKSAEKISIFSESF